MMRSDGVLAVGAVGMGGIRDGGADCVEGIGCSWGWGVFYF